MSDIFFSLLGLGLFLFVVYGLGKFLYVMLIEFFDTNNTASNVRASAIILLRKYAYLPQLLKIQMMMKPKRSQRRLKRRQRRLLRRRRLLKPKHN